MKRGPCTFRQQDVTRAIRAAFAAGASRAEIRVGEMVITAEKATSGDVKVQSGNEWDTPHGDSAQ
jgi:hypothetical protein